MYRRGEPIRSYRLVVVDGNGCPCRRPRRRARFSGCRPYRCWQPQDIPVPVVSRQRPTHTSHSKTDCHHPSWIPLPPSPEDWFDGDAPPWQTCVWREQWVPVQEEEAMVLLFLSLLLDRPKDHSALLSRDSRLVDTNNGPPLVVRVP